LPRPGDGSECVGAEGPHEAIIAGATGESPLEDLTWNTEVLATPLASDNSAQPRARPLANRGADDRGSDFDDGIVTSPSGTDDESFTRPSCGAAALSGPRARPSPGDRRGGAAGAGTARHGGPPANGVGCRSRAGNPFPHRLQGRWTVNTGAILAKI